MTKVIDWEKTYKNPIGDITAGIGSQSTSRNMKEAFAKSYTQLREDEKVQELMNEILPIAKGLLFTRMTEGTPLKVVRPLRYTTESLGGQDEEEDDGFYMVRKSEGFNAKYQSIVKTIRPGTELTFINLEKSMGQLWFRTNEGKEIGIYLQEQDGLLTQTDIFDIAKRYVEGQYE